MTRILISILLLICTNVSADPINLELSYKQFNLTGKSVQKLSINGTIPGPTLEWYEGQEAQINVTNNLGVQSSIHWHGLILPGIMDGAPGVNGFKGIDPGETYHYKFPIKQSGTYWYHAHSNGQEQDGLYGSIIIHPKIKEPYQYERDYVVLLSDFSEESSDQILSNLKTDSAYYNYAQRTFFDFLGDVKTQGFKKAWADASDWAKMRMSKTDLADVSGYTFLVNGKTPKQNWTGIFSAGERVRLRFINASAMSIFDVRVEGLPMTVIQADGQDVEQIEIDEFRIAVAETYDVIVTPKDLRAYNIIAEPIDRTGMAIGTLAPKIGMTAPVPTPRKRTLLTMSDMGHGEHSGHAGHQMMQHQHQHTGSNQMMQMGWDDRGSPANSRILDYKDLRSVKVREDTEEPSREITLRLGGNMERYIWTINGKRHHEAEPIPVKLNEKLRLTFINETMMAHPVHLHGMFVQLENGQPLERQPNKHTIIVPPGKTISALLRADQPGEWMFHCHLLYHMLSGMMTTLNVTELPVKVKDSHAH